MREVAVIGVGMIRFGRYDKSVWELARDAILEALQDAGVEFKKVEALYSGNMYRTNLSGQQILQQIGLTGIPVVNVVNACATGSTAVREAYLAVAMGLHDIVVAVGSEQMGKMGLLGADAARREESVEGILGSGLMPAIFSTAGVEHMRKYGTTIEQFAKVSVKNHKYGYYNPRSQYRVLLSLEDVLNSRMISYPNTLYMCCPTGDGAAAVVLAPMSRAREFTSKPVKIAASVLTTDPYTDRVFALPDPNTMTRNAAKLAYEQAGVGPEDLDLVELHDCFATAEILHYENLGLCPEGEGGRLIDEGETEIDGRIPVNISGGLLSLGHPIGATGVSKICECVWQLRGEAQTPDRQVPDCKVALAHTIGLASGGACTIHILVR